MRRHAVWAYFTDPNLEESLRKVAPRNFTGAGYWYEYEYNISFAFGSKKKAAEVAAKLRRRKGVSRVERSLLDDMEIKRDDPWLRRRRGKMKTRVRIQLEFDIDIVTADKNPTDDKLGERFSDMFDGFLRKNGGDDVLIELKRRYE